MSTSKLPFDYRHNAGVYLSSLVTSKGSFDVQDDVVIDGEFEGTIQTAGFCEISENGKITGDIVARTITILGSVTGDCNAKDSIDVKKSSKVKGQLVAPSISIEAGAQINIRGRQPSSSQTV